MNQIPSNWIISNIEDCVIILDNLRIPINSNERGKRIGSIPYYGATGQVGWIDDFIFDEELVLVGEDGAPFFDKRKKVAYIISGKSWVNNHAHVLKAAKGVTTNNYLLHFFNHFDYTGFVAGSTRLKLTQQSLKKIPFPLAPYSEQKRIAQKLDIIFQYTHIIDRRLNNLPELIRIFRDKILALAFTGKLTHAWRNHNSQVEDGVAFTKRVIKEINQKDNALELKYAAIPYPFEVPESWCFSYLQNFGEVTRGKSKHRPRNDPKLFGGKYPFIQTGDVTQAKGIITEYKNTYNDIGLRQSRLFPKGTLCITIAANIAETGILNFDSCFPDSVVGYLPYKGYYSSKFVMYYFRTIQKDLEHFAPATAQKNINLRTIYEIPFPIPPLKEQEEIVRRVEELFVLCDKVEARYKLVKERMENFPIMILNQAFIGKLVKQDMNEESTRILTNNIKKIKLLKTKKDLDKENPGRKLKRKKSSAKTNNINMALLNTIKKRFGTNAFTYDELDNTLQNSSKPQYIEMKKELFELLRNTKFRKKGIKLLTEVDNVSGVIKYKLSEL